jgi:hypothetical protein
MPSSGRISETKTDWKTKTMTRAHITGTELTSKANRCLIKPWRIDQSESELY